MRKFGLLANSALRSAVFAGVIVAAAGAGHAQTPQDPQDKLEPNQGTRGVTASGSNPDSAPADEEPAQDQLDPDDAADEEPILVTGSRIPRPQFEGVIPGAQVTAEQIEARGFTHLFDVLDDIPLVAPSVASVYGVNSSVGGASQATSLGLSFANLLGLGSQRTLTLVNGRRFVSSTPATNFTPGSQSGTQVDLSMIPAGLTERIDILTVGGAAAYGSDAIAGVINVILKDDFNGVRLSGLSSVSDVGDAPNYSIDVLAGRNFAGGRVNLTAAYEFSRNEGLAGAAREEYRANYNFLPNMLDSAVRNPNFLPSLSIDSTNANNGAFLRAIDDGQPGVLFLPGYHVMNISASASGQIFQAQGSQATLPWQGVTVNPATLAVPRPTAAGRLDPNGFLVPRGPVPVTQAGCSASLPTLCRFAPQLQLNSGGNVILPPGITAQQVINRYAPGFNTSGATTNQINTLAINLLQANLPTVAEFLQTNPGALGAILGTFTPGFLDAPNTDSATASFLPLVARPLRFDRDGNVVSYIPTRPTPDANGGILGLANNPDAGVDRAPATVLRVMQERHIGNLFGKYDLTDNLTVYMENLFARVRTVSPGRPSSANLLTVTSTETGPLVFNINNPFLDADDRANLRAAGVVGNFTLGRQWQDVLDDYNNTNTTEAYRGVLGLKGDLGFLGRKLRFDVAGYYGRVDTVATQRELKDIEFALAINAVRDPITGQAACAAKVGTQVYGSLGLPPGVVGTELIRERGPDGMITERILVRQVTPEQVAACQPLNPFGENQMSQAAKEYVRTTSRLTNLGEQRGADVSISTSLVDLPAGPLGVAFAGEYRRDLFDFRVDDISRTGAARLTPFSETAGYTESTEFGAEARIPIFGDDFHIPGFRNLEISPAVRFVRLTGDSPDVRRIDGSIDELEVKGNWDAIWSVSGTWRPVEDILFRGNITRSIRSASVVELFLGLQPAIANPADPCSVTQIQNTSQIATRRANCRAAVIAAGLAQNSTGADIFLANFNPPNAQLLGGFSGSPDIEPERGRSWTAGVVLSPSFVPRLTLSADYIDVTVKDLINRPTTGDALKSCYDNPDFPDTPEFSVNLCDVFSRNPVDQDPTTTTDFHLAHGFQIGYYNQGALRIRALNLSGLYNFPLREVFGSDLGNLELYATAYHLIDYRTSTSNDFVSGTTANFEGTFGVPRWKAQLRARYERGGFYAQWVTNYQSKTDYLYDNAAAIEVQDLLSLPAYALHDAALGFHFGGDRRFGLNFSVSNVTNKKYLGSVGAAYAFGGAALLDPIGRRYTVSGNIKF
ncbi:MAG TPA: TonB-dependent receptor [Allosphingosinicella sp.]